METLELKIIGVCKKSKVNSSVCFIVKPKDVRCDILNRTLIVNYNGRVAYSCQKTGCEYQEII